MAKAIITVKGMSCGHCKQAVEKAVGDLTGVGAAEVDLAAGRLTVDFDAAQVDLAAIKTAVAEAGFTAE